MLVNVVLSEVESGVDIVEVRVTMVNTMACMRDVAVLY